MTDRELAVTKIEGGGGNSGRGVQKFERYLVHLRIQSLNK